MNDPEYLSASPTVMAYDYASGDYFAPAYLGAQTSAQAHAAAVAAVGPTGMEIAQPAPLVAHPTPQYPRVGHEPTFTMPMNKGEWNIRGVNIPSYSPALPPMPGSDWRTFPQPIDGAQLNFARPQFAAFAGLDGFGAVSDIGASREVQGGGGYRYKQFKDGAIQVLVSPDPQAVPPGTVLRGDTYQADPAGYKRWVAITTEIGAWKDFASARGMKVLSTVADIGLKAAGKLGKRKGKKRKGGAVMAPAPGAPLPAPVEEEKGFMAGPMPWVIGGGIAVLVIALLASRSSSAPSGKGN
jgi:hypothetical protein